MSITDNILDAVDILIDNKVSNLQFNKTVRAKISEVIDASIGKYKVQYQNSYFTAYSSDSNATYQKGSEVYVEILSSDFEKNALIIGTVRRLGSNYITIVEELDKFYNIGAAVQLDESISFCSYDGAQTQDITNWDSLAISEYAAAAEVMKLGMKVQNKLATAQRSGGGNYGINVVVEYYDEAYADPKSYPAIERLYTFDINDMTGQPYKYIVPSDQYALFEIDAKNFKQIKSITAFCKDFPVEAENKPDDIWFTDINLQFMKALTEDQLQTTFLAIDTPYGNYFTADGKNEKTLKADLRIKGKKVNYESQQIDFYWFKRNLEIDSDDTRFSAYGGNGWELLNTTSLNAYEYTLSRDLCLTELTQFKCVAVYTDSGQSVSINAYITIKNISAATLLSIESSMGQVFAFNLGKTTLTLLGYTKTSNTRYCWTESINGGAEVYYNNQKFITDNFIEVDIATPAANSLTYECSVYEDNTLIGSAKIVLLNNKESLGYTLVLKDAQQIFKYDIYGTSPASQAVAAADRMTIPALSFDIYDKQGQLVNIADEDKNKYMSIKWLWPAPVDQEKETMLTTAASLTTVTVRDIANNRTIQKKASVDKPTFTYGIRDVYNAELANTDVSRNNIILEVDYQGEYLVASTNFTFTKEGELGTNGTKYVARVVPKDPYEEIFIMGSSLYGIRRNSSSQSTASFTFVNLGSSEPINNIFEAQLWDGRNNVIASASVKWAIASSTTRTNKQRLTINQNNDIIVRNGDYTFSNVLQAVITLNGIKYYATYPIIYTTGLRNNKMLYIADGYREVMYENDGTRGRFNGLPFVPKWFGGAEPEDTARVDANAWDSSWGAAAAQVENSFNQFTIEPPSYYNAEQTGHYIKLTLDNITTYVPIELYLNRYGMSAMNDWDGNSVQVNSDGGYILSPQVGAGRKNDDNSFTGITIGEVFQDVNNKEIGMFGYYKGQRSLFLDAETGDAEFGVASEGQIKIRASDGQGTISDGHYHYDHTGGTGKGMKIKFTSTAKDPSDPDDEQGPYIKYGTGNFMVDANGYITAQGGGSVAGWKITDISLSSQDDKTNLYSSGDTRFNINNKFYIYSDGRFSAANAKFSVDADGKINSTEGKIGGFSIEAHRLYANTEKLVLNDNGSIYGPSATYNFTPNQRVWEITPNGYAYFTDVKIRNNNAAEHGANYDNNYFSWVGKETVSGVTTYPNIFTLTDTGSKIGGWNITGNELTSGKVHINSSAAGTSNAVLSIADVLQLYGDGSINAGGGGSIGGASFGAGGNGAVNFPAGIMQFGGETVTLNCGSFIGNIFLTLTGEPDAEFTDVTLDGVTVNIPSTGVSGSVDVPATGGGTVYLQGGKTDPIHGVELHGNGKVKLRKYKLTGSYSYTNASSTKVMGTQWNLGDIITKTDGQWISNN